jgi:hypothetical protein
MPPLRCDAYGILCFRAVDALSPAPSRKQTPCGGLDLLVTALVWVRPC